MRYAWIFLLTGIIFSAYSQPVVVDAGAFQRMMQDSACMVLDVRSGMEYTTVGHIPGAVSVNYLRRDFISLVRDTLAARNTPCMLVYCMSGHRSAEAVKMLYAAGYRRIYELKGGLISWIGKGLPVE